MAIAFSNSVGTVTDTESAVVAAPGALIIRVIKTITAHNADTVAHTFLFSLAEGALRYGFWRTTLGPGESDIWADAVILSATTQSVVGILSEAVITTAPTVTAHFAEDGAVTLPTLASGDLSDMPASLAGNAGKVLTVDSGETEYELVHPSYLRVFSFGISGAVSVAAGTLRILVPAACVVTNVTATVGTAPTGADLIVDINLNGTTLFTTQADRPTIAATTQDDLTSVPAVVSLAQNDVLTMDVDQVGSTVAGSDLLVQVRCIE